LLDRSHDPAARGYQCVDECPVHLFQASSEDVDQSPCRDEVGQRKATGIQAGRGVSADCIAQQVGSWSIGTSPDRDVARNQSPANRETAIGLRRF
jgi:hypothetical protein